MKTTNYYDTFIEVAEDCPVGAAEIPPRKSDAFKANLVKFIESGSCFSNW